MDFLNFGNSSTENFKNRSTKALHSFYTVLDELKEINAQSVSKQNKLREEKLLIDNELAALQNINESNFRVICNIEKILE
jgi:hypothetical protein